jgi:acyl-CoA-binding protein
MSSKKTELQELFDFAVEQIRVPNTPGSKEPTNDEKLKFYGLYKQSMIGKCNTTQPWLVQVVERGKWDAWNALGDMSKETAMTKYCDLYMTISAKYLN